MRIALISYEYPPDTGIGGIATYVQQLSALLVNAGHSVEVFSGTSGESRCENSGSLQVHRIHVEDRWQFPGKIAPIFGARHCKSEFDVVESPDFGAEGRVIHNQYPDVAYVVKMHTPTELVAESNACRVNLSGYCRYYWNRARIYAGAIRRGRLPKNLWRCAASAEEITAIERDNALSSDLVTCPSSAILHWARDRWAIPENRCMVVPNPYVPSEELLKISPGGNGKVVGFCGRLEVRKGILELIEAIPKIIAAEPEVSFRLVGNPLQYPGTLEPFDVYIRRKLRNYMSRITLVGYQTTGGMANEYAKVDVSVIPSRWENFPNVCLEAMSAARAVVGSEAGGMAEMLVDGAGVLIPPRSSQKLSEAVIQLIRSPQLCVQFGEAARKRVLAKYSTSALLPVIEQGYQLAVKRKQASLRK